MKYIGFDYEAFSDSVIIFACIDIMLSTTLLCPPTVMGMLVAALVIGTIKKNVEYRKNHESEVP